MATINVESTTQVPLLVSGIVSQLEPTGTPEFQFTDTSTTDPDAGDWVAGSWDGTWNAQTGAGQTAVTPITGATGFTIPEGNQTLWIRWAAGAHTPVFAAATVVAR